MVIKKKLAAITVAVVCGVNALWGTTLLANAESGVAINETNFPDAIFREYVTDFDTDGNGYFSEDEIANIGTINVPSMGISDLTGIEHFTALEKLYCWGNSLTSLDVSENTALVWLECGYNPLTGLDVGKNTALEYLSCYENSLTSLDVSKNTALWYLSCPNNTLTSLDVSKNTALRKLFCGWNEITNLDISTNTELVSLVCSENPLASLNVSANTKLEELACSSTSLTSLDVSANTELVLLECMGNSFTSLDVSANTALQDLRCDYNSLTSLDLSANTTLVNLDCFNNEYEIVLSDDGTFDLSALPEGFDLSKATEWTNATVDGNILTIENAGENVTYTYDTGYENVVFTLAHEGASEPGTDPIEPEATKGDVTGDGNINLYDAIEICRYIMEMRDFTDEEMELADYNGDGYVNLYDVIEIAKYMMNK